MRSDIPELDRIAQVVEYTEVGMKVAVLFIHESNIFQLEKELS
jgi:hypothetical protein